MNPLRDWNAFWFRPVSARPLGAFRVVIGFLAICHLLMLQVDLDYWLTDRGLMVGPQATNLAQTWRPSPLHYLQDPLSVRAFVTATTVVAVAFTLGWHTRVMGVLLYLGLLSILNRHVLTNCGPDTLLQIMVFYLMIGPSGAAYSLDARRLARRRGTVAEPIIASWAPRLIQLHVALIYFDTAVLKCAGTSWLGGTALHYVLHNHEVGRFDFSFLTQYPVLLSLMTLGALFVEFAIPFLLWFRATRPWMITCGLALHGTILFVVNVPLFGELMTACYLTFLTPQELDTALNALNPRRWIARARPAGASLPENVRLDAPEGFQGTHAGDHAPVSGDSGVFSGRSVGH